MSSKYTCIYVPGSDDRLRYVDEFDHSNDESEHEEEKYEISSGHSRQRAGFADAWKENREYIELVESLNLNDLDIQQLWDILSQEIPYLIEDHTTASSETVSKSWIEAVYRHFLSKAASLNNRSWIRAAIKSN